MLWGKAYASASWTGRWKCLDVAGRNKAFFVASPYSDPAGAVWNMR